MKNTTNINKTLDNLLRDWIDVERNAGPKMKAEIQEVILNEVTRVGFSRTEFIATAKSAIAATAWCEKYEQKGK